jgi:AcrR family transcriptional regulator
VIQPATAAPPRTEAEPKPKRASALPPDERRSMIVAATLPLLLEHGDRVTSKQIAEAAGIAEGTIFRAFTDKDEVIAAVIEAGLDPAPMEAALSTQLDGLEFEAAVAAAIEILQRRVIDVWRLVSSVGAKYQDNTRRPMTDSEALIRLFETHRAHISVEPKVAARLLRALTLSTTHPMLAGAPMSASEVFQLFVHGVGAEHTKEASC